MVKGLDRFAEFFAGNEAHYVLIGGVATHLALEDAGLQDRATKDLDILGTLARSLWSGGMSQYSPAAVPVSIRSVAMRSMW